MVNLGSCLGIVTMMGMDIEGCGSEDWAKRGLFDEKGRDIAV